MIIIPYDRRPITEPGIYSGVPMRDYHGPLVHRKAGFSLSRSKAWTFFDESPAHAWDESPYNPDRNPDKDKESDALRLGRIAHHLLLGEADFLEHFALQPDSYPEHAIFPDTRGPHKPWNANSDWCRKWLAQQEFANRTRVTETELENVKGMANGLMMHPLVRAGILNGLVEHTICVQDPDSGIWIKIRPDVIPNDSGDFADLKTAADVSDEALEEAVGRDGLFLQAGMTALACRLLPEPIEVQSFNLVFSEKTRPFCARVRAVKPHEMELGEQVARTVLKAYARCIERNTWPGPGGEETDAAYIEMKPFRRGRIEERLKLMEKDL